MVFLTTQIADNIAVLPRPIYLVQLWRSPDRGPERFMGVRSRCLRDRYNECDLGCTFSDFFSSLRKLPHLPCTYSETSY